MRSVVVVLPASMCAMMPMLRTLSSWNSLGMIEGLPAVVRERAVGLGHLMGVLALLERDALFLAGRQQLVREPYCHRFSSFLASSIDDPAHRNGGRARGLDLDGDLISRAADAAGLDLEQGPDVLDGGGQ